LPGKENPVRGVADAAKVGFAAHRRPDSAAKVGFAAHRRPDSAAKVGFAAPIGRSDSAAEVGLPSRTALQVRGRHGGQITIDQETWWLLWVAAIKSTGQLET
jgi:hypothetical protein